MAIERLCPSCGFVSDAVRCPRCNTLLLSGCTGSCSGCGKAGACKVDRQVAPVVHKPSDDAPEDEEHPGTPLER